MLVLFIEIKEKTKQEGGWEKGRNVQMIAYEKISHHVLLLFVHSNDTKVFMIQQDSDPGAPIESLQGATFITS